MKIQEKKKAPQAVLVVLLIMVVVLAGGAAYWYFDPNGFFGRSNKSVQDNGDTSHDDGKTDDGSTNNAKNDDEEKPVETDEGGKKVAELVIVDASQYGDMVEMRVGVTNLVEENGRCEFTFMRNGVILTRTSDAIFSGTRIDCRTLEIPAKDFPAKGEWQMIVKYTSATAAGSSQTKMVMVK